MSFKVNIDSITLDVIATRLKGVVSHLDILKWIANFKDDELSYAVDFLNNLTVFTSNEIEEIYHNGLNKILKSIPNDEKIVVHPIGLFGKSGSMMAYLLRKTDIFIKNPSRIILCSNSINLPSLDSEYKCLVLLDDFVGTGGSVETYFNSDIVPHLGHFNKRCFLGVAAMENGLEKIKPFFDHIEIPKSNIYRKAFSNDASYFGYRKYKTHRETAYEYGKQLTKPEFLKSGIAKYNHALGYKNSQALVAFFYGSPNNSLPIFWQGGNDKINWFPLIPRFNHHKIQQAKEFRKKLSFELSLFKEFGSAGLQATFSTLSIRKGSKRFSAVNHIDFSLYGILKLTREGFSEFSICQRLGITFGDYLNYLKDGKAKGIFDSKFKITLKGLELYEDAKKCISKNVKVYYEDKVNYEAKNIVYIPKSFNGGS
ncbi:hypothetical protein HDF19_11215 [Mucilaginibacter sp. E4BP6]|uniref:phosphoribosyltransferase-like protein n=1 Tax=Mucilaginibacter sp. E4BP6 TaxID=2723089 RepID=UPI0015CBD184|nr:hypothetical protein [Mucilaginibacter sp. E4BP6]NYE65274.1 hypothetical protein [Mucilaginibacter sp. E4BP6]